MKATNPVHEGSQWVLHNARHEESPLRALVDEISKHMGLLNNPCGCLIADYSQDYSIEFSVIRIGFVDLSLSFLVNPRCMFHCILIVIRLIQVVVFPVAAECTPANPCGLR